MNKIFEERMAREDAYDRGYDAGYYVGKRDGHTEAITTKHGQWECEFYNDIFDVYQADCSVCKRESTNKYDKVSEDYEYCPHCGAVMREEK
jgi:hypothetical protein